MRIYLVRHGSAAEPEHFDGRDEDRPLTAEGRQDLARLLRMVSGDEKAPVTIWTSPLVRAVQTAEMIAHRWSNDPEVRVTRALVPEAAPTEILEELQHGLPEGPLALVGHMPNLGAVLARLIGSDTDFALPKAGIVRLRFRPGEEKLAEFRRLYAPDIESPITDVDDL